MNIAWVTDIHLNFVDDHGFRNFVDQLNATGADAILIGGDIGEARSVSFFLERLAHTVNRPLYFVLGNHDYYHGSISKVRSEIEALSRTHTNLVWLPASEPIALGEETGLIGHGGWGDGRLADFLQSTIMLNDYILIEELTNLNQRDRLVTLNRLGDEAAEHLRSALLHALRRFNHIIILMHVPPFREASWHEGKVSDDQWLPHFSCGAAGQALLDVMGDHPGHQATVLCGHTHGSGITHPLSNLVVHTGAASYGRPEIQRIMHCI